jgi:hypothetical protein
MAGAGCSEVRWEAFPFGQLSTQERVQRQVKLNAFYAKRGGIKLDKRNTFVYKINPTEEIG